MSAGTGADPAGLVRVTRSGGFAGVTLSGEVDLDRLDGPDLGAWRAALDEGLRASPGRPEGHRPAPDRFVYRVRSAADDLDVTVGDHELPDGLRALLDRVVLPPRP